MGESYGEHIFLGAKVLVANVKSDVYAPPLKLEDGKRGTFLETCFDIKNNDVKYWLKNENEEEMKIWRYKHFHSHGSYVQKRAIVSACLRKTEKMASDTHMHINSALIKINEFIRLHYPITTLKGVCTFLAATSGNGAWITIRNLIR